MAQLQLAAGLGVDVRDVWGAVVGHHAFDVDAVAGVELDSALEEGDGCRALLIGENLGVGQAAVIVDRDMHELPASEPDRLAVSMGVRLSTTAAGDAMAWFEDPPELLDVDVDQLARPPALIAIRWLRRISSERLPSPTRFETADTVESAI